MFLTNVSYTVQNLWFPYSKFMVHIFLSDDGAFTIGIPIGELLKLHKQK